METIDCVLCKSTKSYTKCWYNKEYPAMPPQYQIECLGKNCGHSSKLYDEERDAVIGWNNVDKYDSVWNTDIKLDNEANEWVRMILKIKESIRA